MSNERSGHKIVEQADAGSLVTVMNLRDEETFSPKNFIMTYDGTATQKGVLLEVHDADTGDAVGDTNKDGAIISTFLNPGDGLGLEDSHIEDITDDVMVVVDRGGKGVDGDVSFTIGGEVITS